VTAVVASRFDLDLETFERVAWNGEAVEVAPAALERMREARAAFLALLERQPDLVVYGVTSGFGESAGLRLDDEQRAALAAQPPLTGSSFGDPLPGRIVRGIVLARLANFVDGHAAVRPELAVEVAALLGGELPPVPRHGNGGAGEILALGHLFAAVGHRLRLEAKEGLALVNGSPCAAALVADAALGARSLQSTSEQVFALAAEAFGAPLEAYAPELAALWLDEAEGDALRSLNALLADGSAARRAHQAPVSFRILPRVLGRSRRAAAEAARVAETSLQAVTDNPVFVAPDRVLSNGGYHNALAGPALDGLGAAAADLCVLAERQTEALLRSLLETNSCPRPVSTLSMVQAGLAEQARRAAQTTVLPLGGLAQNDTPSPAFFAWDAQDRVIGCLRGALAALAVVASQTLHERGRQAPPALADLLADVRGHVPVVTEPRPLGAQLEALSAAL
jgi:histidine ammonia-lyase